MRTKLAGGAHADNRIVRMLGIHFTVSTGECGDRTRATRQIRACRERARGVAVAQEIDPPP
ncbi:hypothetical protein [Micromonospora echinaurantiaca]|uniref:hypothetical protein n=1 Tax=Micromonospora echinaurantiaca TaxID=47857 RepID=UPI0037A7E057